MIKINKKLEALNEYDQKKAIYLIEEQGYEREQALDEIDNIFFYEGMTLKEVAEELVDEGCFGEVPERLSSYIDFEAIARDLAMDGYHETDKGVFEYR